jgi:hypothetical protein
MAVSDAARRELYDAVVDKLGPGPAETMMELLPPVGWGDVARQSDITALRGELMGEIAQLRGEMRAQFGKILSANAAMAIAVAGLVLAAARLA